MDISVIIPVADDLRIKECIESIDEDVEVVIALNGATDAVRNIANNMGVKTCELAERNLGAALDEGIITSTKDNVLITDSDCTFGRNCIKLLYDGLDGFYLSKGRIIHEKPNRIAACIADLREFKTEGPNAFKPPLAMKKSIINHIGYYYDRDIHWVEDAEFYKRVKKHRLTVNYVPDAMVYHPSLTPYVDLQSAFRYGTGKRIGVEKNVMKGVGTHFTQAFAIMREKDALTSSYSVLWNLFYSAGFFAQAVFGTYGTGSCNKKSGEKQ